ncbi:MAG TPA: anti-sigma factor [Noviherbaspirillum sp.]|uniref:anti-sigma factor family protein n=1 Tax=Noviherbaspirillum sp. TaxID=1926288 RepID=UPI002D414C31|nr:anti-sigma factor [Noviherbaspirillum sp.]HYD94287.1 anti-sigma factor [Noviherbaspirillum sp.]
MKMEPIGEYDLHAYVDNQLDAVRRAQVEAYLAVRPDAAAQVQALQAQNRELHEAYDKVLNEPVPLAMSASSRRKSFPLAWAASIAALAIGLGAGWSARGWMQPAARPAAFAERALSAHLLYVGEKRHPVEVPAEQEAHLVAWLSKRLDAPVRAPALHAHGFSLLGGRLLPGDDGPLAQFMYESAEGERLTLLVRRVVAAGTAGFRVLEQNGNSVFYWIDRDYGYALSGNIGKNRMLVIAEAVDAQLRVR